MITPNGSPILTKNYLKDCSTPSLRETDHETPTKRLLIALKCPINALKRLPESRVPRPSESRGTRWYKIERLPKIGGLPNIYDLKVAVFCCKNFTAEVFPLHVIKEHTIIAWPIQRVQKSCSENCNQCNQFTPSLGVRDHGSYFNRLSHLMMLITALFYLTRTWKT